MFVAGFPVAFLEPPPGGGAVFADISPASVFASGVSSSWQFAETLTCNVTGGSGTAFVWSFRNIQGGVWQITSGQGTASITIAVNSVAAQFSASAEALCTVTVLGEPYTAAATVVFSNLTPPPSPGFDRPDDPNFNIP
jgi:hypothetical protein